MPSFWLSQSGRVDGYRLAPSRARAQDRRPSGLCCKLPSHRRTGRTAADNDRVKIHYDLFDHQAFSKIPSIVMVIIIFASQATSPSVYPVAWPLQMPRFQLST